MPCPITPDLIRPFYEVYPDTTDQTGAVTLHARTAGTVAQGADQFATYQEQPGARKVEPNLDTVLALGGSASEEWCEIHIWIRDPEVQTLRAKVGYVLSEASTGKRWRIRKVANAIMGVLDVCTCQREVSP